MLKYRRESASTVKTRKLRFVDLEIVYTTNGASFNHVILSWCRVLFYVYS